MKMKEMPIAVSGFGADWIVGNDQRLRQAERGFPIEGKPLNGAWCGRNCELEMGV
jgi:hypothetical protein